MLLGSRKPIGTHTDTVVDGIRWPSVTEIVEVLSGGKFLLKYYEKHSLVKARAVLETLGFETGGVALDDEKLKKYGLKEETFWQDAEGMSEAARTRGVEKHAAFEEWAKGWRGDPKPDDLDAFTALLSFWAERHALVIARFEAKVRSDAHKFAGTFDALFTQRDGGEVLADWKFTSRMNVKHVLQMAGYDLALGGTPRPGYILRFYEVKRPAKEDTTEHVKAGLTYQLAGSTVKLEEHYVPNLGVYHDDFLACKRLLALREGYSI